MLKPIEKPIKFVKNLSTKGKSYPITHVSAVIDDNGESVKSTIDSLKNKALVTKVTWLELKDKRNAGKLTPGSLYRITDYNCTTTQENTQSAGHQFDIVLLALSEDKLAEEGWAMMHDNIYNVTFADGVTKKCFIYHITDEYNNPIIDVVDIETKLGLHCGYIEGDSENLVTIDENAKTASTEEYDSIDLTEENLTYNYFQNSNLSAWKVWYCLDNDKSRFAWADDKVIYNVKIKQGQFTQGQWEDAIAVYAGNKYDTNVGTLYQFVIKFSELSSTEDIGVYTTTENLYDLVGTEFDLYMTNSGTDKVSNCELQVISKDMNGRGVIYRLIDEWNIDYPCDFKNIQMLVPMDSDDNIDIQNPVTSKYCYAFTDNTTGKSEDLSINGHAINIKVKPKLTKEVNSAMYFIPKTLFYTNHNDQQICIFSNVTVGIANTTIFINRGYAINILDESNNVILKNCGSICIGYSSRNVMLDAVVGSTFGSYCKNIQLVNKENLNYGNGGVELATKS